MTKEEYFAKFKDPRWQKMRLKILERDEFTCQSCGNTEEELQVHHKYYEWGNDPWDYPERALVTLCASCHEYERETISDSVKLIGNLFRKNFLSKDMISFEESVYSRLCNNTNQSPEILLDVVKGFYMDDKFQRDVIELYRELVKQPTKDKYESGYWLLLGQPRV